MSDALPPNRARQGDGFTLVEMIVVLSVMAILVGSAVPLLGAAIDAERRSEVERELDAIGEALDSYYFDRGAFPASLTDPSFATTYLHTGVNGTALLDSWGGNVTYVYVRSSNPDTASVYSRGPNGSDDGLANEEQTLTVHGAAPGLRRTRQRMRVIVEALANHLEAGGTISGSWPNDRAALGLGTSHADDGFGTPFSLDAATLTLRSAGPDRIAGNADDVTN
jgi:general secretion pathway protein G